VSQRVYDFTTGHLTLIAHCAETVCNANGTSFF